MELTASNARTYRQAGQVRSTEDDDSPVLLHLEENQFFGLNPVAGVVWVALKEPRSREDLLHLLQKQFPETAVETVERDLDELLAEFVKNKIVVEDSV